MHARYLGRACGIEIQQHDAVVLSGTEDDVVELGRDRDLGQLTVASPGTFGVAVGLGCADGLGEAATAVSEGLGLTEGLVAGAGERMP